MKFYTATAFALIICALLSLPAWTADTGTIRGLVTIPVTLDTESAPEEAKVYVYLVDLGSWDRRKSPWPPISTVQAFPIRSIEGAELAFEFRNVPTGSYRVGAFLDAGRPHIRPGARSFVAYPGDYTSLNDPEVSLKPGDDKQITISYGARVTVPEGYTAPKYLPE
jgi:hypothetical protein